MLSLRQRIEETFGPNIDLSGGLRQSFLAPVYWDNPELYPYQSGGKMSLRKTLESWRWPEQSDYVQVATYPDDHEAEFSTKIQGCTHFGDRCWIFSQDPEGVQGQLTSVDVRQDLRDYPPHTSTVVRETNRPFDNNAHYGDCSLDGDLLVVPSHDNSPNIAVFYKVSFSTDNPNLDAYYKPNIAYLGSSKFVDPQDVGGTSVPWCAFIPSELAEKQGERLLVSSFFRDYPDLTDPEKPSGSSLLFYFVDVSSSPSIKKIDPPTAYSLRFKLKDGSPLDLRRIQGGVVSAAGHLYIVCDLKSSEGVGGGVHAFDLATGRRIIYLPVDGHQSFSSFELEGIDVWDLDEVSNAHSKLLGQVHLAVFNADVLNEDNMYILNWQVTATKRGLV